MEMPPRHKRTGAQIAATFALQWVIYGALWFLFTGSKEKPELILGALCAAVAAGLGEIVGIQPVARFSADMKLVGQIWRLPKYAITGTWEIFEVLFAQLFRGKPAPSLLRAVPFDAGREDDPKAATRRALAVTYTTMTPNFVVVGIDQVRGLLLFHQIKAGPVLPMTENLGAKP